MDTATEIGATIRSGKSLDMITAAEFRQHARDVIGTCPPSITVDLAATEYMDTAGLAAVVAACRYAREHDCPFTVVRARELVLRMIQIAGLTGLLNVQQETSHA